MTDRYPHAPACHVLRTDSSGVCNCGANQRNADFEAGRKEADARAMAVVEMAIRWAEADTPVTPEDDALFDALVSQGFITKDGERR